MLTQEENVLLTQTGPGTPMGELFRRFWIPACLSEEIPGADCPPIRVRLLSEDLIAFRDSNGVPGLVDAYCPHRGAPLFFGRNEEGGLRCVYHGWKYDVTGKCVDLPNSPEGETYKDKVTIKAYPAFEGGGMIWAYMGPKEKAPPKPQYEWLDLGKDRFFIRKYLLGCNYFQSMEGDYDPSHAGILHSTLKEGQRNPGSSIMGNSTAQGQGRRIRTDNTTTVYEDTPFGALGTSSSPSGDGQQYVGIHYFFMPSATSIGFSGPGVYSSNIRIPIDDENCYLYRLRWSYEAFSETQVYEDNSGGYIYPEQIPGTYIAVANKDNDYLINRVMQKNFNFTGITSFPVQDNALIEDQRGPVMDRRQEHLVSADAPIISIRKRLLQAARDLMEGQEPEGPNNPASYRVHEASMELPADMPLEEAGKLVKEHIVGPTVGK